MTAVTKVTFDLICRELSSLSVLKRLQLSELNMAIRAHLGIESTHRNKDETRTSLARVLAKYFPNTDTAMFAYHIHRRKLSEKHRLYIPTDYGNTVLSQAIDKLLSER